MMIPFVKQIASLIFPVGRGFIDFTNTDYSNYLGLKWERELVGMTPVGIDTNQSEFNTIGKTGGEKSHILKINEIPSHTHPVRVIKSNAVPLSEPGISGYNTNNSGVSDTTTQSSGGGLGHNNLQPYKVVAYWKRIE